MDSRIGKIAGIGLLALVFMTGIAAAASTAPCSDGTPYGKCSNLTPGWRCWIGDNGNVLMNAFAPGMPASWRTECACSNFPGYVEVTGACVKNTCTDSNGATLANWQCGAVKPQQCVWGSLISNSSYCGCPAGQKADNSGKNCGDIVGCRWNGTGHLTCPPSQECKWNPADNADGGTCTPKQGCAYNNPPGNTLTEDCITTSNANGVCKTKAGCQYNNPACGSGTTCNQVTGNCDKNALDIVPVIPASNATNTTGTTGIPGGFSCCCLPAAGATAMVGLASYQHFRKKEEE
ncbi:MAG: hypothetical protein M1530_04130 [Candidatus Marsarchaeota archaeon]|nr:hypothetical protein [Candidatus Marsarchaeota archaeon]